jgi:LPS-assembly protein
MGARVIFLPGFHHSMRSLTAGPGMPVPSARLLVRLFAVAACVLAVASPAFAQLGVADTGFETCKQFKYEKLSLTPGKAYVKLNGAVECANGDLKVFADQLEYWADTHKVVLTGNVTFRDKDAQVSADRAEFNSETRLGTFFNASGFARVAQGPKRDALGGQEPDVYFYGDTIEKIGEDTYRITHGGFTTCVQPTPRWQITSGSTTLRLDHYAFLTNALIKAKGVPVFYLPALYYPIQKGDRATGILMPTYGTSTYKGFTLSNAFFWAISRSQDATLMHDWFKQRGQGFGAEYRYIEGPGSTGYAKFYNLREHESTYTDSSGNESVLPARTSYEVRSSVSQSLGRRWTARGRVDYFTDITVNQTYNTDIYDTSRSSRTYGGGVNGSVAGFTVNGSYDRTEYFAGVGDSTVTGYSPRVSVARNEKPLFGAPLYFSVNTEFAGLVRQSRSNDEIVDDRGLRRLDVMPVIRIPFTKLRFLTVNSSVAWRGTWWTRSLDTDGALVDQGINRSYFDLQSRITGPVFNRVWNTPGSGYASKWKHTVEPFYNLQYVTAVDKFDQIIQLDSVDYIVGGTLRMDYGLTNRLMAKRGEGGGSAREVVSVVVNQTYYTDARASQYDYNYTTSFTGKEASNFSPVRINVRATPADRINGTLRLEYDTNGGGIQSIAANGEVAMQDWLHVNAGFSQRRYATSDITQRQFDNYLTAMARIQTPGNRVGGTYTFNYDIGRSTMLSSRIVGYYNAQCCGFALEYQTYNFPQYSTLYPVQADRRFNFSFTLAGLGTFSNFFGAFGGGGMGR